MITSSDITKPLNLARGIFYIVEFSAKGGVRYERIGSEVQDIRDDESMSAEYSTRKEVDHIGLQTWSRKIVNSAYNVMERHCSQTPIGYWIAEENSKSMLEELAAVRMEAGKLNDHARSIGSRRRAIIDAYAVSVSGQEDDEKAAIRLAQTVRERLQSILDDLKIGDLNAYATSWKRAKNLPRLATGIQAEAIVMALTAAKEQRAVLAEAIRGKRDPELAGKGLNLDMLESAIFLFTDSVNGSNAVIEDE